MLGLLSGCSYILYGKYTTPSYPAPDYKFYFSNFTYYYNGDVYGNFGKGNINIKKDTLILIYKDLKPNQAKIKYKSKDNDSHKLIFSFRILNENKLPFHTRVFFINNENDTVKIIKTDFKGEVNAEFNESDEISKIFIPLENENIEIQEDFSGINDFYIKNVNTGWLRLIDASEIKYRILDKNRHRILLESTNLDTFALVRKRFMNKFWDEKISREKYIKKINK